MAFGNPNGSAGGDTTPNNPASQGNVAAPIDIQGEFPAFIPIPVPTVNFPTIKPAPFNFTDPTKFVQDFSKANREQLGINFGRAQDFALQALDTELKGLKSYAPAAAALGREQISLDNQFNQFQRTRQVRGALPGVEQDLFGQRSRANSYAQGRLPDAMQDRALELGIRSRAGDRSSFGGFGPKSMQSNKMSDLMSAEQRFQIGQYGENLLTQNIGTRAGLFLAPTEYSQAGSQIRPTPEVGAGRLTYQGFGAINEATLIPPSTALQATIQQEEFSTNLNQRTREYNSTGKYQAETFNATNALQAAMFNSTGAMTAGLGLFNYQNQLASQTQAANQAQLDTAFGVSSQGLATQNAGQQFMVTQPSTLQTMASGVGAAATGLNAANQILTDVGITGGTAGGTNTDTSPAPASGSAQQPLPQTQVASGGVTPTSFGGGGARSYDASLPSGIKFADGVAAPAGYAPIASNGDGTYSAANIADYKVDLERFGRLNRTEPNQISIQNAAQIDRTITNSTGLSYVPMPGMQPVSMTTGGKQVYSLPDAASSPDITRGATNIASLASIIAQFGVDDPAIYDKLRDSYSMVSDPGFHATLDNLSASEGPGAVSAAIWDKLTGGKADMMKNAAQQLQFGAGRIGELWPSLSPQQKSMALTSLTGVAVENSTGKNLAQQEIPGSAKSPIGPLKTGEAMSISNKGLNGFALARNWPELSSIAKIAIDAKDATTAAKLSDHTGLLGYGAQGSSVPLEVGYLSKVKAEPAPEFGIGAAVFSGDSAVPRGYQVVSRIKDNKVVALPANLATTSPFVGNSLHSHAMTKAGLVSTGRHQAQRLWKDSGNNNVIRGAAGGSSIVSGLTLMAKANPMLHSAIIANSLFNETLGTENA